MPSDVTADLIRALIDHMRGASDDWESMAMVIDFRDGRLGGTHGYTYSPDGAASAVASRPSGIKPAVDAFTASYYQPGERLPVQILVQFERTTGTYETTFEDTDPSRWQVTPANIKEIAEKLKPSFD